MKLKKITNLTIIFALLISLLGSGFDVILEEEKSKSVSKIAYESKEFSTATIDQDFSEDSVLVVMDKSVGAINKVHDKNFFCDVDIKEIVDLSAIVNETLLTANDYRHIPNEGTWEAEFIAKQKQFNAKNQTKQNNF